MLAAQPKVLALDPLRRMTQYHVDTWGPEQGLRGLSITSVVQTPDGYLWLGTRTGLVRFNGVSFTTFTRASTPQLPSNIVTQLKVDGFGTLWIATISPGVTRYREGTFRTFSAPDGLPDREIAALHLDRNKRIVLAPFRGGLLREKDNRFEPIPLPSSAKGTVAAYAEMQDGTRWYGSAQGGVVRVIGNNSTIWTERNGLPDAHVAAIHIDKSKTVWVGTSGGLATIHDEVAKAFPLTKEPVGPTILTVAEDLAGSLWVGTLRHGLFRIANQQASQSTEQDLPSPAVLSLIEDKEGSLFIGTRRGLARWRDSVFLSFDVREGWPAGPDVPFLTSSSDELWVRDDHARLISLTAQGSPKVLVSPPATVQAQNPLLQASDGSLWLARENGVVARRQDGTESQFRLPSAEQKEIVFAMAETRDGSIWFGAERSGLYRWKDKQFKHYSTTDGLPGKSVTVLSAERNGGLWVGTRSGLALWKDEKIQAWTMKDGLSSQLISALFEEGRGRLWIGTSGGLNHLSEGRFRNVRTENGLPDEGITALEQDAEGNLWASCNIGILRLRRPDLESFLSGLQHDVHPDFYGASDGLRSSEGVPFVSARKTSDGKIWFRMRSAFVSVQPDRMPFNRVPPSIATIGATIDGVAQPVLSHLAVPPGAARVELRFAALSFLRPERNRLRYKLEGYDQRWTEIGQPAVVTYTRLPPGSYNLHVTGANSDGVWSRGGIDLRVIAQPLFWQTSWFAFLCLLAVALAALGLHRLRLRQIEARHALVLTERTRIARELHDTLAQGYVGISSQLVAITKLLEKAPDLARNHLEVAARMAKHSLTEARRAIQDLRDQEVERTLARTLPQALHEICATEGLPIEVSVADFIPKLQGEAAQQVLRVAQEAVANSVRHARAHKVFVSLCTQGQEVRLLVRDDGCGFDPKTTFSTLQGHFGLIGMRERAARVGGRLVVESVPGVGTQIEMFVPYKYSRSKKSSHNGLQQ